MFNQIFTIHACVGDVMFALVFSLLPKRDTATYNIFFTLLKDIASRHNLNFSPRRVSLNFECASRNAATDTFPSAELLRSVCCSSLRNGHWFLVLQFGSRLVEKNVLLSRSQLHNQLVWCSHLLVLLSAELLRFLFHYAKTIWRKIQYCGLQTAYKDVPDVTKLVRRAACLPRCTLEVKSNSSGWKVEAVSAGNILE
jgi:hypothetical protein